VERYIGLDAHTSSCTVAVVGPSGRRLSSQVVETNAKALIEAVRSVPAGRHLCLEEGALAGWLYETLAPHVQELVVAGIRRSRGPKSDQRDAFGLAEMLRIGAIPTKVYKQRGLFTRLAYLAKAYHALVVDSVRVQHRIKSLLRSRGVAVSGRKVFTEDGRGAYLAQLPAAIRPTAEFFYQQHDYLRGLRREAQAELVAEARKHTAFRYVRTCPGFGDVRAALILPVVVTPYRFANKRRFWSYCGLAVVTRSSSDWVRDRTGAWLRAPVMQTRGLNKNHNRILKNVFKGAATTVILQAHDEPLYQHYQSLLDGGTKPNLAKLTIARQLAAIALTLWREKEVYDPKKLTHAS
jgi:transposase